MSYLNNHKENNRNKLSHRSLKYTYIQYIDHFHAFYIQCEIRYSGKKKLAYELTMSSNSRHTESNRLSFVNVKINYLYLINLYDLLHFIHVSLLSNV